MRVGLIDIDSKQVNLALMKLSAWHKAQGDTVVLNNFEPNQVDTVYISVIFTKHRAKALKMAERYNNTVIGGSGYDLTTELPAEVEEMAPDYDLYRAEDIERRIKGTMKKETRIKKATEIVNAGIGFLSRGCVRKCKFCIVPKKEGALRRVHDVKDLINPRSNIVTVLDANLLADPNALDILEEFKDRDLKIDITQGIDVRLLNPKLAKALGDVRHLRSVHYAWDLMSNEHKIMQGIDMLTEHIKTWKHQCYILCGFNTTPEEDMYRVTKLRERGILPYVMQYQDFTKTDALPIRQQPMTRLRHFARWVNGKFCKSFPFEAYRPWIKFQEENGVTA